jgi:hypothetical protein
MSPLKVFLSAQMILMITFISLQADVKSLDGNIEFKLSEDGIKQMHLNSTGLGIGPNVTPSTNLDVAGNSIISQSLTVGGTNNTSNSNLHIQGSISYTPQSVSSGNHSINSSYVLADTSAGNVFLSLPALSESVGSQITIKRTNLTNQLYLSTYGANVEGLTTLILESGNLQSITLINNGSSWYLLQNSENSSFQEIASSNLFLWWGLGDNSGNVITDLSPYGRSGNLTNGLLFGGNSISAPLDNGLLLSSSNVSAIYDDGSLPTTGYSYALWSQVYFSSEDSLVYEPYIDGTAGFVWASGNAFYHKSAYHQLNDASYVTTNLPSNLSADTWYHIAVTWDGSDVSLYLNGEFQSGNTATTWMGASNIHLTNPGTHDNGESRADDLRFYNKALSADEIRALYLTGQP